jgi:hypothetical protein
VERDGPVELELEIRGGDDGVAGGGGEEDVAEAGEAVLVFIEGVEEGDEEAELGVVESHGGLWYEGVDLDRINRIPEFQDYFLERLVEEEGFAGVDVVVGGEEDVVEVVADEAAIGAFDGVPEDDAEAVLVVVPAGAGVAHGGVEDVDFDAFVGAEFFIGGGRDGLGHGGKS